MNDKTLFLIFFSSILCGLGLIFLLIFIGILSSTKKKRQRCTSKALGTIKDLVKRSATTPRYGNYHPVIEYQLPSGEIMTVESNFGSSPPKYSIGQEVYILYDPNKPDYFYIADDNTAKILVTVFGSIGIGMISVGILVTAIVGFLA